MEHGHEHASTHAHADADAHHGPAELPPEPSERWITPAPEDFAAPPPAGALLWPLLWFAVAALLVVVLSGTWPEFHPEH
jgi:hypothetical protein